MLGHPSIVRGFTTFQGNDRWFLIVADHYANRTFVIESTDATAATWDAPAVMRNEAMSSDAQEAVFGFPTPSSLTLVDGPSFDSQAFSIARARKDSRGSWTTDAAPKASFTKPRALFPEMAVTAVGDATGFGEAGQITQRTILIGKGALSATRSDPCLYEFLMDSESSAVTGDPNYGAQDPGRQAAWRETPGCIALGDRPSFAPAAGAQVLAYARYRALKGARVSFFRYTLAGGRENGPKGLNTDFSKGRTGAINPVLTQAANGKLTLLWWAGKGQVLTLGVAHSSGARNAGWTGKRTVAKSNSVIHTLRGVTFGNGSGLAIWEDGNKIKVAGSRGPERRRGPARTHRRTR